MLGRVPILVRSDVLSRQRQISVLQFADVSGSDPQLKNMFSESGGYAPGGPDSTIFATSDVSVGCGFVSTGCRIAVKAYLALRGVGRRFSADGRIRTGSARHLRTGHIMSVLQAFIITMGLAGQVLIARKDHRGYAAWIAGNLGLMIVYHQTHQPALIGLQVLNTTFQVGALIAWKRSAHRASRSLSQTRVPDLITPIAYRSSGLLLRDPVSAG